MKAAKYRPRNESDGAVGGVQLFNGWALSCAQNWDAIDCLAGPSLVVVRHEFARSTPKMPLGRENEVAEAFSFKGTHKALQTSVRIWGPIRYREAHDSEHAVEPVVESAPYRRIVLVL